MFGAIDIYTDNTSVLMWGNDLKSLIQSSELCKVKSLHDNCGLSYMWENQSTLDNNICRNIIFGRIEMTEH